MALRYDRVALAQNMDVSASHWEEGKMRVATIK